MDLTELLRGIEGNTLEFKRGPDSPPCVLRTLVASANTAGGKLSIGVEDATRAVCGVSDPMVQEERLAPLIADSIEPRLLPDMEILPWRQTQIIAVTVFPSQNRPHHLRREGAESGAYAHRAHQSPCQCGADRRNAPLRTGGRLRSATHAGTRLGSDSEVDGFRVASESFAPLRKLTRGDLATLRLTPPCLGRRVPSSGGLLLFGTERLLYVPGRRHAACQTRQPGGNRLRTLPPSLHPVRTEEARR